jgi:hypothetical protein
MTKIGILACKMLQDEIIYLIQNDPKIQDVVVIEEEHAEFVEKLDRLNIPYQLVPSVEAVSDIDPAADCSSDSASDSISFVVWNLTLGLHAYPKILKEKVYECAEIFAKKVNGIYLLYGLCGNVLERIEDDLKPFPLVILRDKEGCIADDCISATIGGRPAYLNLLKSLRDATTFIFTPMFAVTSEEFFEGI